MKSDFNKLPKVDEILLDAEILKFKHLVNKIRITTITREVINLHRENLSNQTYEISKDQLYISIINQIIKKLNIHLAESLKKVINATGIIIHTNLGRIPLDKEVCEKSLDIMCNYNNLEYSTVLGKRRERLTYIKSIISDLTGAESSIIVNNNAAAVYLILNTLCNNKEIILSRGEIVEIGDSFRISEIIQTSGAIIKEVGTTNKTKLYDYESNITEQTAAILKVHTSNFTILGFTEDTKINELVNLKHKYDIPIIEDMGSGILFDLSKFGLKYQRTVMDSIKDGADIICISGDKMLGASQVGIIIGKEKYISKLKSNPLYRCLRVDKLSLITLQLTLEKYFINKSLLEIPLLKYITYDIQKLHYDSIKLKHKLLNISDELIIEVKQHFSQFGGGSLPNETIDGYALFIKSKKMKVDYIHKYLRNYKYSIITTMQNDSLIINLRTVIESEINVILDAFCDLYT